MIKTITTYIRSFTLGVLLLPCVSAIAIAEARTPADAVLEYFSAAQDGNIAMIRNLISGSFYHRRQSLLDSNAEYSAFLKQHYSGSTTTINSVHTDEFNGTAVVNVTTRFPGNTEDVSRLLLKQSDNNSWIIIEELNPVK